MALHYRLLQTTSSKLYHDNIVAYWTNVYLLISYCIPVIFKGDSFVSVVQADEIIVLRDMQLSL